MTISRRDLLKSAALAPFATTGALRWIPGGDDRCLVVVELAGGNDGLNTLIPLDDPRYIEARPVLAAVRHNALPIGDGFALHPAMVEVHAMMKRGVACAVHGVGYAKPDRSHFRSRDIWYTADPEFAGVKADTTGWLGRAADLLAKRGAAVPGLSLGSLEVPLALRSRSVPVPSLQRIEDYQLLVDPKGRDDLLELIDDAAETHADDDLHRFLGAVSQSALASSEQLRRALERYKPKAQYPENDFGKALQLLGRVIVSGFGTRLFHLRLGGFDTHARQAPAHDGLLRMLSKGLAALIKDLEGHSHADRVTLLVHSEFGRRVAENRSQGTDHGAAAPVFVFGAKLENPLVGDPPALDDLDDGDLKATCDFRAVYARVLERTGIDSKPIVGPVAPIDF